MVLQVYYILEKCVITVYLNNLKNKSNREMCENEINWGLIFKT